MDTEKNTAAPPETTPPPARRANFLQVMAAVFWSFLGIRKKARGEQDLVTINPLHVVAAGLIGAALFVAALLLLVRFITKT